MRFDFVVYLPGRGNVISAGRNYVAVKYTKAEVADIIEQFLDGTGGRWDWDDFTSIRIVDPELDAIRLRCGSLYDAAARPAYCGHEGVSEMRQMIQRLRESEH